MPTTTIPLRTLPHRLQAAAKLVYGDDVRLTVDRYSTADPDAVVLTMHRRRGAGALAYDEVFAGLRVRVMPSGEIRYSDPKVPTSLRSRAADLDTRRKLRAAAIRDAKTSGAHGPKPSPACQGKPIPTGPNLTVLNEPVNKARAAAYRARKDLAAAETAFLRDGNRAAWERVVMLRNRTARADEALMLAAEERERQLAAYEGVMGTLRAIKRTVAS